MCVGKKKLHPCITVVSNKNALKNIDKNINNIDKNINNIDNKKEELIYKHFYKRNCRLLSRYYRNQRTKMLCKCECGSYLRINYRGIKKNKSIKCNECYYNKILLLFRSFGCELLTKPYIFLKKSSNIKLSFIAACGHKHSATLAQFKRLIEKKCPKCILSGYSNIAIEWLENIAEKEKIYIQHAKNNGEYKIKSPNGSYYKVDGYCKETNTIYEFYGDYWHGNPDIYEPNDYNAISKKTMIELYYNTLQREKYISWLGYNIVSIWENEYLSL